MTELFKENLQKVYSCAEIAVPLPLEGLFSYIVPQEWEEKAQIGVRVRVPFRNREIVGYLVGRTEIPDDGKMKLKPLMDVLDDQPVLSKQTLELTKWISEAYASSWGEAIENALPKWVKYGKKAERALKRAKDEVIEDKAPKQDLMLSEDQQKALTAIEKGLNQEASKPILLFGVTGSGKSEVYIRSIREVLKKGKTAICLVPEIALTEQIRRFFLLHFGNDLVILHSKLSDSERFVAWKKLESGEKKVVLGPRSAVFAPALNLGLIIIDEEHEGSYKQETTPRYHAREVAAWRTQQEKALLVMGTATPSLESMSRTERGEVERIDLPTRIDDKAMPVVDILDFKAAGGGRKRMQIFTPRLEQEIEANLEKKEGTILLLNRRGFSTYISCTSCGTTESCESCQVSLIFHQEDQELLCHYCNYRKKVPTECTSCKAPMLRFSGFGTEKVESELGKRFPEARIARMDADTVRKKGSHEEILKEFRDRKVDILLGTQMIAKGFDFPHVTLVGVVLADVGLSLPDFRSSERTFQLLTQVAGRAGRGNKAGRVVIQTFSPNHPSLKHSQNHDFLSYFEHEMNERQEYQYPPFLRLSNVIIRSKEEMKAYKFAREFRDKLRDELKNHPELEAEVIGPAPLPFYKLRGHFRWHVMVKSALGQEAAPILKAALNSLKKPSAVAYAIDIDPLNIL